MIRILKSHARDFNSELLRWLEDGTNLSTENLAEFFIMKEEHLFSLWREKRGEILADWKRRKRPGRPYIVSYIEEKMEYYRLRKLECPAIEAGYSFEDL